MRLAFSRMGTAFAAALVLGGCVSTAPRGEYPTLESSLSGHDNIDIELLKRSQTDDEIDLDAIVIERLQEPLTADSVVAIALLNNHAWRARYHRLGVAEADLVAAGLISNPSLGASFRFPASGSGTNVDLDLVQEFINLLMRPARLRLARTELVEVEMRTAHAATQLVHDAQTAYFTYAAAEAIRYEQEQAFEVSDIALTLARETAKAGNISELDLARHETHLEHRRIEFTAAQRAANAAKEKLNSLMGLTHEDPVWFLDMRALPETNYALPQLSEFASVAVERRLDLQAAGKEMEVLADALGITRNWRLFASVEIGATAEREFDGEWSLGPSIEFEIPVFNRKQDEILRLESMLRESEEIFLHTTAEISAEVRESYQRAADLDALTRSLRETYLPGKRRIVELTQREYNFMLVDTFHLLEAKEEEYEARSEYLESLRDYWIALADLQYAVGGVLPQPNDTQQTTD